MPVTQRDIAQKLGVSRRLVGYALSGDPRVGEGMRRRIHEEAASLGYQPNRVATALSSGLTYQIVLCFPFLGSSFYNEIIRHFERLARGSRYDMLITTFDDSDPEGGKAQFIGDGMIFVSPGRYLPRNVSHPVVVLQNQLHLQAEPGEEKLDCVQIDIEKAAVAAMEHLLQQGFRRIAYTANQSMMHMDEFRYRSYQQAMQRAGLQPEIISLPIPGEELMRQKSHKLLKAYFENNGVPEALFCSNDDTGIGAYRALAELGRSVPGDMAVLSFDDLDDVRYLNPPMSAVHMPISEACRAAWDMLMRRLNDAALPPMRENFEAELVIRGSTIGRAV